MLKYLKSRRWIVVLPVLLFLLSDYASAKIVYFPLTKEQSPGVSTQGNLRSHDNYELQGDKSPWIAQIPFGNVVIPFTPMLYTNETWIAQVDQTNIKSVSCTGNIQCSISQLQETKSMLTYNITGNVSLINNHQVIYTSKTTYFPQAYISGGLGLGVSNQPDAVSFTSAYQGDEPIFSIYISRSFIQSSTFTIGGYDSQYVIHNANFKTLYPISTLNWTFQLTQVANQGLDAVAIIDQNLPYIGIPNSIYLPFVNNFTEQNGLYCSLSGLTPICSCDSFDALPTLDISIGGDVLNLPPSAYTTSSGGQCTLLFTPISSDNSTFYNVTTQFSGVWVLGEPFMDYYYLVFYYEAGYLNVAPSVEVSTSTLAWILLISICSIGFIAVVAYRFWQLSPKRSKQSQDKDTETKENIEDIPIQKENTEKDLTESLLSRETMPSTQINIE